MSGRRSRALRRHIALAMTAKPGALALGILPHQAAAANVTVSCSVTGPTGLAQAITDANAAVGSSTLTLASGCLYDIATPATAETPTAAGDGLPTITNTITMVGNGATITRDNAAPNFRILHVGSGGNLSIDHVTISNGVAETTNYGSSADGGGIAVQGTGILALTNSTVTGNTATSAFSAHGGGISNNTGSVTLTNTIVSGNTAAASFLAKGGGVWSGGGSAAVTNLNSSSLTGNHATATPGLTGKGAQAVGGGMAINDGTSAIQNVTISANTASGTGTGALAGVAEGGGIAIKGGNAAGGPSSATGPSVTITGSTVSGNTATAASGTGVNASASGGGIEDRNQSSGTPTATMSVKLANDTIANNTVTNTTTPGTSTGGGMNMSGRAGDTLAVVNSTIANNASTNSGIDQSGLGTATVTNTILSANGGNNCRGTITDGGHNISFPATDTTCLTFGAANHDSQGDPKLAALASNGGPTQTMALGSGSAAVDAADPAACKAALPAGAGGIDQRGLPRAEFSTDPACDIGAFEDQLAGQQLPVAAVTPSLPKAGVGQPAPDLPWAPLVPAAVTAAAVGVAARRRSTPD